MTENLFNDTKKRFYSTLSKEWVIDEYSSNGNGFQWSHIIPFNKKIRPEGWKIHFSASVSEFELFFNLILPLLIKWKQAFKFPSTPSEWMKLNEGKVGVSQIGKVLTIYPDSEDIALAIAEELHITCPVTQGPSVQNEYVFDKRSPVSLRYGSFKLEFIEDEFGRPFREETSANLQSKIIRKLEYRTEEKLFDVIESENGRYLPLKLIRSGLKKIYQGLDLNTLKPVILKTVPSGYGGSLDGASSNSKFFNEFKILNDIEKKSFKSGIRIAPKAYDCFITESNTVVLVMEEILGVNLSKVNQELQISLLPKVVNAVKNLHDFEITHRDLKMSNIMKTKDDEIILIDFEISSHFDELLTVSAGTRGYMPPEGVLNNKTDERIAADSYSFGAMMFHIITGTDPSKLPLNYKLIEELILDSDCDAYLKKLTLSCISQDFEKRPNFNLILDALNGSIKLDKENIKELILNAARATKLFKNKNGSWSNNHMFPFYECQSINLGASGIIMGLLSVRHALKTKEFDDDIKSGLDWLLIAPIHEKSSGLFTGNAGVALALALGGKIFNNKNYIEMAIIRFKASIGSKENDFFSGKAGVIYSAVLISRILNDKSFLDSVEELVADLILNANQSNGVIAWSTSGKLDSISLPYTGVAHGSAGIAMAIHSWAFEVGDQEISDFAVNVIKSLYNFGRTNDKNTLRKILSDTIEIPSSTGSWCHGPSGFLWSILNGFKSVNSFKEEIDWASRIAFDNFKIDNSSYCHGHSGQLELLRMLKGRNIKCVVDENKIVKYMNLLRVEYKNTEVWSADKPDSITPDLWVGFMGPAVSLAMNLVDSRNSFFSVEWLCEIADNGFNSLLEAQTNEASIAYANSKLVFSDC